MNQITLHFCFVSNFHVGSGYGHATVADQTIIRNFQKLPYIPASTIKGKLRSLARRITLSGGLDVDDICQTITKKEICKSDIVNDACIICRLFGSPLHEGKLIFCDGILDQNFALLDDLNKIHRITRRITDTRPCVKIGRTRRIATAKSLFTIESTVSDLQFTAKIQLRDILSDKEKELIDNSVTILTHLGGQLSRGWGKLQLTKIQFPEAEA